MKKIDAIFKKLYEDNTDGKISDEQFAKMIETYEAEQNELKSRSEELKAIIAKNNDSVEGEKRFIPQVRKNNDIKELNAGLIRELVEKIYVSEKQVLDGKKGSRNKNPVEFHRRIHSVHRIQWLNINLYCAPT